MTDFAAQISQLVAQERALVLPRFDSTIAYQLGSLIRENFLATFDASTSGIVISIHLFTGHTLFACAVGSSPIIGPDNWDWIRRKSNTVKRYGTSSFLAGRRLLQKGRELDYFGPEYAAHGGAFPILIKGLETGPVGVVAVSGLKQEDDHQLVVEALEVVIKGLF
ncbi:hypothetical protein ACQY0O_007582 [Thecaphora frezii]